MASRANRFRNDHETRGRRPKALEAPKEPARPRTHWDHVLEEMVWLAKDFESERKWKMGQAKRVAVRASKSRLEQASRGERRMKEEEQRVRRVATNISKDVKKFWMKIEKLVLYKHQLELEERKKKALDKQLDFLLGQTERYSTMLAENLVDLPFSYERSPRHLLQTVPSESGIERSGHQNENDIEPGQGHCYSGPSPGSDPSSESPFQMRASVEESDYKALHKGSHLHNVESEDEFCLGSEDDLEDDEATLEADEALITKEERREELSALQNEIDLPLEEILKRYKAHEGNEEESRESSDEDDIEKCTQQDVEKLGDATAVGESIVGKSVDMGQVLGDDQYKNEAESQSAGAPRDESKNMVSDEARSSAKQRPHVEEIDGNMSVSLLVDLGEHPDHCPVPNASNNISRATVGEHPDHCTVPNASNNISRATVLDKSVEQDVELPDREPRGRVHSRRQRRAIKESVAVSDSGNETDDGEYILAAFAGEDKDDETTLVEEEELARSEVNDTTNEIELLKQESELPIEELLARYKKDEYSDEDEADESENTATSSESKEVDPSICSDSKLENVSASTSAKLVDNNATEEGILEDVDAGPETKHVLPEANEEKLQNRTEEGRDSENIIADAAAAARSAQPTGNTFSTTKVRTKLPFLLKHSLREYQHIGLDWLVTMYEKRLNGILADEMGLGKTIMTISLLAHLACEKGIWGPHLIVVPTSVMLNWETEFMKWCPAFKVLTYFGNAKERKVKRQGWSKPNSFHVCITTYRLVIQDAKAFKRKKWKYLILDEAHLIKNWKSQRWQTLLNFNSKRRILLTGTPLQNDLMELWSLMHFLMPHVFQSHQEFKDWFSNPITGMVEGQDHVNKEIVDRLHNVLRPFILRRLKRDVEKQLPKKYEHVICCRLSRRQRNLYEDFIASSETQATLASGNFLGMINVLMQLRKVCNHPDLFEGRPIISSFDMAGIEWQLNSSICTALKADPYSSVDLTGLNLLFSQLEFVMNSWEYDEVSAIATPSCLIEEIGSLSENGLSEVIHKQEPMKLGKNIFEEIQQALQEEKVRQLRERAAAFVWWNSLRCRKKPLYGSDLRKILTVAHPVYDVHKQKNNPSCYLDFSSRVADLVLMPSERCQRMLGLIELFVFAIPPARTPPPDAWCSKLESPILLNPAFKERCAKELSPLLEPIRPVIVRRQLYFPDKRLIQFDCGKLQELAVLLRRLKSEGHRALIFTQMTKMLDVLEAFINLYGYTYMRLDGSTQPEERQTLMQRFNTNPKIFLFILSTRSGGVGINLVGADTVIFYDSDWNPAMDQQAQDRCHRIGQTREVHIYRLISESTIEENILKKANQKRALDNLVIQSGGYNTEFFKKLDPMELFSGHKGVGAENPEKEALLGSDFTSDGPQHLLSNAEVEAALKNAEDEADYMALKKVEQEEAADNQEFMEEAVGKLEDDEYANEEEGRTDEKEVQEERDHTNFVKDANADVIRGEHIHTGDRTVVLADVDEDIDMLADVKQMAAAAAAAGHASSSFENHLLPIERYAMRFLDLWDPIIDKAAVESQVRFEEMEWELDRLEKLKEEQEAEIDEDDEPLFYESWDTDFANEAYRQQVEALAQQQLMQDQLEWDSGDEAGLEDEGYEAELKHKLKKKLKKTKFKSLKKGSLASDGETLYEDETLLNNYLDLDHIDHSENGGLSHRSHLQRKRKAPKLFENETFLKTHAKKFKKELVNKLALDKNNQNKILGDIEQLESADGDDLDTTLVEFARHKNKMGSKVSMLGVPPKKFIVIKQEKIKKKGTRKSKDSLPSADSWSTSEDAILCAIVHEYGGNWDLASSTLYGMPGGGFYRGRYRHPIHCRERFRELFLQNISSVAENSKNEKIGPNAPSKALLKVTEEHVKLLLDVAHELPDNELLLQKHFAAVLSSVSSTRSGFDHSRTQNLTFSNNLSNVVGGFSFIPIKHTFSRSKVDQVMRTVNGRDQSFKLVAAALADSQTSPLMILFREEQRIVMSAEQLEVTLEFPQISGEWDEPPFPYCTTVVIHGPDVQQAPVDAPGNFLREPTCNLAEDRLRVASRMLLEGEAHSWASSALACSGTMGSRSGIRSQYLGKHRPSTDSAQPPKPKLSRTLDADGGILASNSEIQSCEGTSGQVGNSEVTTPIRANAVDMPLLIAELKFHMDTVAETSESVSVTEIQEDLFGSNSMCDAFVLPLDGYETIPHCYDTSFDARFDDSEIFSGIF